MSARVSRSTPPKGAGRNLQRKRMVLDVDLNAPPSDEVGSSSHVPLIPQEQGSQQQAAQQVVPIDVDSFDDDVVVCSPRAFAEAQNNSRRNQTLHDVIDITRDDTSRRNKRQRIPIINCESYIPERNYNHMYGSGRNFQGQTRVVVPTSPPPPPPPPPPEPTFSCPICMGPLQEEMTTKCGHIFCKACIKKSISTQGKCPSCRRKVTWKDTIRIYLPTS